MKLKTLRDIEVEVYRRLDGQESFNTFQMLKEEAIKWAKEWTTKGWLMDEWMKFFNITEDDLK